VLLRKNRKAKSKGLTTENAENAEKNLKTHKRTGFLNFGL
jgi:hypothetical protein